MFSVTSTVGTPMSSRDLGFELCCGMMCCEFDIPGNGGGGLVWWSGGICILGGIQYLGMSGGDIMFIAGASGLYGSGMYGPEIIFKMISKIEKCKQQ